MHLKLLICGILVLTNGYTQNVENEFSQVNRPPKNKQITYAINVNAKTPYEIFIDDIPVEQVYQSGMNSTIELNQYLLRNGNHTLTVRYLPRPDTEDGLLYPEHVIHSKDSKWNIFFVSYVKNADAAMGYEGEIDYQNSELEVQAPSEPVPYWEQKFELDIKDLPYELVGWSNGRDLSQMDKEDLEKEVVSFYDHLRNLLNNGNVEEYLRLGKKKDEEVQIATYDDDIAWYSSVERKQNLIKKCKGNMLPLEGYRLSLYANGKLVCLERVYSRNRIGSPLIASIGNKKVGYQALLYKPKGSDDFVIIRK
ncbi:hypothetical protein [Sinomicrobium sp. M5D2P17]